VDLVLESAREDAWYGLYMLDRKIGHARGWARETRPGEPGRLVMGTTSEFSLQGGGNQTTVVVTDTRFYSGEPPYPMVETHFEQRTPQLTTTRKAVADPTGMVVTTVGQGGPPVRIPPTKESLFTVLTMAPVSLEGLKVGVTRRDTAFDWEALADRPVSVTPRRLASLTRSGVVTPVAELEILYEASGLKGLALMADGGLMLRMTLGPGLVLKLEEQAIATADIAGLDVAGSGVPVSRRLVSPAEYEHLTLDVTTPASLTLAPGPGQRVERLSPTEHRLHLSRSPGDSPTSEELVRSRRPHGPVDSDHPDIQARARDLTSALSDDRSRSEAILRWVFETLRKELATHIPSASEVLRRRVGDCTEHTWLFVALMRATGLPARPVYGLMYIDDAEPTFGYHAWAEVVIDGRWVAVDPTWGQFPADATHLRLGTEALGVASAIGGLAITLPEHPTR